LRISRRTLLQYGDHRGGLLQLLRGRVNLNQLEPHFAPDTRLLQLSYDCLKISPRSVSLAEAPLAHAKQRSNLRQVRLLLHCVAQVWFRRCIVFLKVKEHAQIRLRVQVVRIGRQHGSELLRRKLRLLLIQ
jgi:hypothetical protein